jgi:EamA domain-containing membrane protein RarD
VNIIGLAQIPVLSILSYVFLKDKMTKAQIITIACALATLLLFMIV